MVTESPSCNTSPAVSFPRDETADLKFVDREEFCQLVISNKTLIRWDDPENSLRGVFDPETRIRYAIDEGRLFQT